MPNHVTADDILQTQALSDRGLLSNHLTADVMQCLVARKHIGYDTIHNVCTGQSVDVPWSIGNWINAGFMTIMILFLLGLVFFTCFIVYKLVTDC